MSAETPDDLAGVISRAIWDHTYDDEDVRGQAAEGCARLVRAYLGQPGPPDTPRAIVQALLDVAWHVGPVTLSIEGSHVTSEVVRCGDHEWSGSWEDDVAPAVVRFAKSLGKAL